MNRTILPYKCKECGEERPEKFDFPNKSICGKCYRGKHLQRQRDYYKRWYAKNGRRRSANYADIVLVWARNHPNAVRTQNKLKYAIKLGLLVRPKKCVLCSKGGRINGHHEDYDLPFEVMWVCSSCHKLMHLQTSA